jgi:hypothetical protein
VVVAKDTNGATIGSATVDANGQWRITPTANVPAGNVTVLATDPAGNTAGDSDPNNTGERNANAISGELDPTSDSGTPGDNKTNDATPTISGTAPVGSAVQVQIKNAAGVVVATLTPTVQPDGTYKITVPSNLADGTYTPVITVTPTGGSPSTVNGTPFTVDTQTQVNLTDPGTAGTRDPISGTGEPGAVVVAKDTNGATIGSATVDANGQWLLKQAIKVGDSGALALRLKEQRQVEQSYRKETKKQQYHKTYPQSCNKTSTTKWLTFEREVWLCLVSESTHWPCHGPPGTIFSFDR